MGLERLKCRFLFTKLVQGVLEMDSVEEIIQQYDRSNATDEKKILIVRWFQEHPGRRFDLTEIYAELEEELSVEEPRTQQILKELVDDSVLESYGDQRKAYRLSDDVEVPLKYQILAGFRHFKEITDINQGRITSLLVTSTIFWLLLSLPFWFFSVLLLVVPMRSIGPFSQSELIVFSLAMTLWLVVFIILTYSIQKVSNWWRRMRS